MAQIDMGNGKSFNSEFGGINQSDHDRQLANSIASREQEIYHYQLNINNFESILAGMSEVPDVWPESLAQYRGVDREKLVESLDDATLDIVSKLVFKEQIRARIRTEKIEQKKSQLVLEAIKLQVVNAESVKGLIAQQKAAGQ